MIPTNILILQMLDGDSQSQYAHCSIHKEPKSFYCMEDKMKICKKCMCEKSHKGHNMQGINDLLSKATTKKNKLKGLLGDLEGEVQTIHALLEENKKDILAQTKDKFMKLRDIINKKEQETVSEIESFFTKEKQRIHSDISLRESIQTKIANLSQPELNDRLLKEIEDDAPLRNFSPLDQYNKTYNRSKQIQQHIDSAFNNLISLAGSVVQEFKPLPGVSDAQGVKSKVGGIGAKYGMAKNLRIEIESAWLVIYPITSEDDLVQVERNNMLNLAKCKEFRRVCLDFRKQKLCRKYVADIARLWTEFQNVTSVKLQLTNKDFTDQDLSVLCSYGFWGSSQVQSLYVYLIRTKIDANGIKKFCHAIDGENIKTFVLDINSSTFTDGCLKELARSLLGKFISIEALELGISGTLVTNSGIEELFNELPKVMPTLKSLALNLVIAVIHEELLEYFSQTVLPLGKGLTVLSLTCPRYDGTAAGFVREVLETVASNLPKLERVRMGYNSGGLTDETKRFIEGFKRIHPNLHVDI